ncbi:YfiT family bacillithiol transferase [Paenibacillus kobensis]|uniref:YfiT family bacillithiol transferase n=1 Tax=Paenibacillus kobensis TaxID=59841 RepID=UPI000FD7FF03|nr:putative metal-dependent hydrolase [Paenibacillus kobensis]
MDLLRYPLGRFESLVEVTAEERLNFIQQVPELAKQLRAMVSGLSHEQLQTPYRGGGWTIQQVVHHMADNDMNAVHRFKRALTEDAPLASSYREDSWAELDDYLRVPVSVSLSLLEALHCRFYVVLSSMNDNGFGRTLTTQLLGSITLDTALQRFVWHNRHHMAQIQSLIERSGWSSTS